MKKKLLSFYLLSALTLVTTLNVTPKKSRFLPKKTFLSVFFGLVSISAGIAAILQTNENEVKSSFAMLAATACCLTCEQLNSNPFS